VTLGHDLDLTGAPAAAPVPATTAAAYPG